MRSRGSTIRLRLRGAWGWHRDAIGRILHIGGPAAAEQIVFSLGFLTFTAITVSLGTDAIAAQQVAFNISNLSLLPTFAFGVAATTLVGQSLGSGDPDRAEASAWSALRGGMLWMCAVGVCFFIGRHQLVSIYTNDRAVIELSEMCMVFLALTQPLQATAVVLASALPRGRHPGDAGDHVCRHLGHPRRDRLYVGDCVGAGALWRMARLGRRFLYPGDAHRLAVPRRTGRR